MYHQMQFSSKRKKIPYDLSNDFIIPICYYYPLNTKAVSAVVACLCPVQPMWLGFVRSLLEKMLVR